MTLFDEVNLLIETLQTAWGTLLIACDGKTCVVSDGLDTYAYEAPTLIEALRLAAQGGEV